MTITQPDIIVVQLTPTNPTLGQNNGSINTLVTGGVPPYTYSWTGPNGPIPGNPQNPTSLAAGTYCVTVTDANLCTRPKCAPVYAPMGQDPNNPSTFKDACAGECNGEIDVHIIGGVPQYIYAWSTPGIGNISDPTGLCPGTYTVTVTSPSIGLTFIQTFTIAQPSQAPNVGAAILEVPTASAACNGSITISPQGGSGSGYTYAWSCTSQTGNPIFALCEGSCSVTITDDNGCTGTAGPYVLDYVPDVLDSPQVSASNACAAQSNGEIQLTIFGGTPPYNYQISGPPNQSFITSQNTYTFSNLPGGSYTYTITDSGTGVDQQSKTGTVTIATTTLDLSVLEITHATGNQLGQLGKVNIEPTGGTTPYTFVWNNGAISEDLFNVPADCYELTLEDANGCIQDFDSIGVGLLTASFSAVKPDCPQQLGSITATPLLSPSCAVPHLPYTYKWSDANGGTVSQNQTANNILPGTYTVTITDANNTSIVQTYQLTSESSLSVSAEVTSDFNGYDVRCFGLDNGAAIAVPSNGVSPYTYTWSNGAITQAVDNLAADSNYTVTIKDAQGCEMTATVNLVGPPLLNSQATASNSGCSGGDTGQATVIVSGGVPDYAYSWSNGDKDPTADNLTPGENYAVTITDFNGCTMIDNVTVPGGFPLTLEGQSVPDSGGPNGEARVLVSGGTPPYTFQWYVYVDGDAVLLPETNSILTELFPQTVLVLVTDANGCQAAQTIIVGDETLCGEVRTVITPEGDGKNEEFRIECLSRFNDNTLEIYNRWGQLVYRAEDYNDDELWRGTNTGGDDVPDGVYFYVFNYFDPGTNIFVTKKGSVTVLRK
ncbi:MAG: gliding motility-associated C-terminal domain-containing protein [Saprospiraceae bacterium]|nr:gliding motility-associated C-terminal domain-containing protein [Saprospiraceae bacterium]